MKDQIPKKLWLIVLAGFLLRLALVWTPPALNSDELIKVYDGACVWSTGMDHHGQRWPLFFKQSGEYSPPLYIYLSGLVAWLGGITTPLTVRLPSVLLGTVCILLAYGLGRAMRGRQLGEWMALLVAFSPWNLHYSRIGWEVILAVTLQLGALMCFFRWIRSAQPGDLWGSAVCFGLTLYAYPTAKLYTPLLMLGLLCFFLRPIRGQWKTSLGALGLFLLLLIPYVWSLLSLQDYLEARWKFLSVFQYENGVGMMLWHYLLHLAPGFLFGSGDANPLHALPGGVVLAVLAPFVAVGFWRMGVERKPLHGFLLFWFLTFAIPASMTYDRFDLHCMPNALRSALGMPVVETIASLGILFGLSRIPERLHRLVSWSILGLILANCALVCGIAVGNRPLDAPRWQYGIQEIVEYTQAHEAEFDRIVISPKAGLHPIALATFSGGPIRPFTGADYPKYVIPFFHYVPIYAEFGHREYLRYGSMARWYTEGPGNLLLVCKPGEILGATPVHTIRYPDGTTAFKLIAKTGY